MDASPANSLGTLKVLVAEDYPDSRDFMRMLLGDIVHCVDTANNGQEALERLATGQYDVVIMDCQMPRVDGYEATRILRQREGQQRHTAIIGLTANSQPGHREKCLAAGMDDFLTKPVIIGDLLSAMVKATR